MEVDHGELSGGLLVDIVVDILLVLPVKSLMRFKCVSRPWRSLISNTKFIALHTKKAEDNRQVFLERRRVVFNVGVGCRGLYTINLDQFLHDNAGDPYNGSVTAAELDFVRKEFALRGEPKDIPPTIREIYFCKNLLFCKVYHGSYLVNPGTRKLKKIPKTPKWRPRPAKRGFDCEGLCGLGFDRATNDYKIVDGQFYRDRTVVYSVYTLRDDSWRQIESHSRYLPGSDQGIFLNGAIHWLVINTCANVRRNTILTFRLEEEEFDEIQLPAITHTRRLKLGLFRDCLCVTFFGGFDETFDEFWVMKEYRVSESWTRMSVFRPYMTVLSQIGFSTESDDVMVYENSFVMYKDFKEGGSMLQVRDIPKLGHRAGVYVEGLFPLPD